MTIYLLFFWLYFNLFKFIKHIQPYTTRESGLEPEIFGFGDQRFNQLKLLPYKNKV